MQAVEEAGWPVVWSGGEGRRALRLRRAAEQRPRPIIEISELTEATAANAMFIHDAAAEWDGSDPIRELGG